MEVLPPQEEEEEYSQVELLLAGKAREQQHHRVRVGPGRKEGTDILLEVGTP